jgi:exopolysaccharide biosynthesis polyprenyl glycosylphosphotransferase
MERQAGNFINTSPVEYLLPQTGKRTTAYARTQAEWNAYRVGLIFTDLACLLAAFICAYWLRFTIHLPFFYENAVLSKPLYDNVMLVVIPIWITIFALMGLYSRNKLLGGTQEYAALFNATTLGMFLIITARFTFPTSIILARGWVILAWLLSFAFTAVCRFALRRYIYYLRKHGAFRSRTLIIGANEEGHLLAHQFLNAPTCSYQLVGFVQGDACNEKVDEGAEPAPLACLGSLEDIEKIIQSQNITHLILSSSALTQEQILKLFVQFGTAPDIELLMSSGLYEIITTGMHVREDGSVPLIMVNKVRLTRADRIMKSLLDLAITIPVLVIGSPLFLLLGLLVKLDSPGPIIYRRRVMGLNGKQFDAFKVRTMNVRSEEILQANPELMREYLENFKIKNDPRVTRIGKFLRKTSLDELPQLINVVRGEMSLVGPRMITPQELNKYNQWGINLLTVKPGLTGLWQVRGRSEISYDERVRMDMYYVRNWSLWFDIQLLIQTIPAVLSKRGAF